MHGEKKGSYKYIWIVVGLLFCVYGLRDAYTVGIDSASSYLHMFERMDETQWKDLPGLEDWLGLNDDGEQSNTHDHNIALPTMMKLFYDWTDGDYQIFIVVLSAFVMLAFALVVRRFSPSPIQSFLYYVGLLLYTFNFSALKQSVAMAFVMLAFCAVVDRKLLRFLLLMVAASMFHFPALIFLPAYWISKMRFGRSYILFLAAIFVLTYIFRDKLLEWMTDAYETTIYDYKMRFLANKVVVILIIIIAGVVIRPPTSEEKIYCTLLQFIGMAAVIQTFASYNNTFERLADYYFQFAVLFIPMVFEKKSYNRPILRDRELALVQQFGPYLFGAFAIWRFLDYVMRPEAGLTPYHFYFNAEEIPIETLFIWIQL